MKKGQSANPSMHSLSRYHRVLYCCRVWLSKRGRAVSPLLHNANGGGSWLIECTPVLALLFPGKRVSQEGCGTASSLEFASFSLPLALCLSLSHPSLCKLGVLRREEIRQPPPGASFFCVFGIPVLDTRNPLILEKILMNSQYITRCLLNGAMSL